MQVQGRYGWRSRCQSVVDGVGCGWLGLESMAGFVEVPLGRGDTKTIGESRSRVFFEFFFVDAKVFLGFGQSFF